MVARARSPVNASEALALERRRAELEEWFERHSHRISRDGCVTARAVAHFLEMDQDKLGNWRRRGREGPCPCDTPTDRAGTPIYLDGVPWYSLDELARYTIERKGVKREACASPLLPAQTPAP